MLLLVDFRKSSHNQISILCVILEIWTSVTSHHVPGEDLPALRCLSLRHAGRIIFIWCKATSVYLCLMLRKGIVLRVIYGPSFGSWWRSWLRQRCALSFIWDPSSTICAILGLDHCSIAAPLATIWVFKQYRDLVSQIRYPRKQSSRILLLVWEDYSLIILAFTLLLLLLMLLLGLELLMIVLASVWQGIPCIASVRDATILYWVGVTTRN